MNLKLYTIIKPAILIIIHTTNLAAYEARDRLTDVFHTGGIISQEVKDICSCFSAAPIDTLVQANDFAQKNLLRTAERWHDGVAHAFNKIMEVKKDFLIEKLRILGMIDRIEPEQKKYGYALILSGIRTDMASRLAHLQALINKGIRFEHIVLLASIRPLENFEKDNLSSDITTEAELMAYQYDQYPFLKTHPMILINGRSTLLPSLNAHRSIARPNTDTTLIDFLKEDPIEKSCLVITNNPHLARQTRVAQRILGNKFPCDLSGPAASKNERTEILIDSFGRMLYEELQLFTSIIRRLPKIK